MYSFESQCKIENFMAILIENNEFDNPQKVYELKCRKKKNAHGEFYFQCDTSSLVTIDLVSRLEVCGPISTFFQVEIDGKMNRYQMSILSNPNNASAKLILDRAIETFKISTGYEVIGYNSHSIF